MVPVGRPHPLRAGARGGASAAPQYGGAGQGGTQRGGCGGREAHCAVRWWEAAPVRRTRRLAAAWPASEAEVAGK